MNSAAFDVYYEHLLLLSLWSDVKNELLPPGERRNRHVVAISGIRGKIKIIDNC